MIPYKENLSSRTMQSSRVYWIEELMVSDRRKICVFFIDREPRHPYNQLRVLLKDYVRILGHDHKEEGLHLSRGASRIEGRELLRACREAQKSKSETHSSSLSRRFT